VNEEKHILTKLEKIYFGKKENGKLTMHEIGVVLDYVALLEQNNRYKNEEIERLYNIINKGIEYIESYMPNYDFDKTNLIKLLGILKGSDKE